MTRIISGRLRDRTLAVPRSGTRPTSDRVREAIFSAVAARLDLDGTRVLDLYAGSGALGLEAYSRGAQRVWLVDSGPPAVAALRRNAAELDGVTVARSAVRGFLAGTPPPAGGVDLVLGDPPYDLPADVVGGDLAELVARGWLAPDALVVWERSRRSPATPWPEALEACSSKAYGETVVEMAWGPAAATGLPTPTEPSTPTGPGEPVPGADSVA